MLKNQETRFMLLREQNSLLNRNGEGPTVPRKKKSRTQLKAMMSEKWNFSLRVETSFCFQKGQAFAVFDKQNAPDSLPKVPIGPIQETCAPWCLSLCSSSLTLSLSLITHCLLCVPHYLPHRYNSKLSFTLV